MAEILFIAPNRIGDAVLATAALEAARARFDDPRVTIATGPLPAELYRATPGLRDILRVEKKTARFGGHWFALLRQLRGRRFDLAVDLRGTLVTYALPARRRIVHRKRDGVRHKLEELRELMGAPAPLFPRIHLDAAAEAAADAALGPTLGPILALGPGSNFIGKQWPAERFAAVARRLTGPAGPLAGAVVVILGGPEDRDSAREIAVSLGNDGLKPRDFAGKLDLPACAAVLARATAFIGNDSGLMHLSAAMGPATLGLFGPSDERVYGPSGRRSRAIRGKDYAAIMAAHYMPDVTRSLMTDLSVDAVEQAAVDLLNAGGVR